MRIEPLPVLPAAAWRPARNRLMRFTVPFLAVLTYYALGVCTFAVMAAGTAAATCRSWPGTPPRSPARSPWPLSWRPGAGGSDTETRTASRPGHGAFLQRGGGTGHYLAISKESRIMPIATPPPDFDPTIVPPPRPQPTQAETWETGIATDPPVKADAPLGDEKRITDLVKLWPEDRTQASWLLRQPDLAGEGAP
jgi:hypothetical protein